MKFLLTMACVGLLLNTGRLALATGASNSTLLSLGILVAVYAYWLLYDRIRTWWWLKAAMLTGLAFVCGLATFTMVFGRYPTATFREDAAIVLGMQIMGDQPSPGLQSRLQRAVYFHAQNPQAVIIVSGGVGPGHTYAEAQVMFNYLARAGVPEHLLVKEAASHSTFQNLVNSREILDAYFPHVNSVAIITNDFHLYRATSMAQQLGLPGITRLYAETPPLTLPGNLTREVAAIFKMWVTGE